MRFAEKRRQVGGQGIDKRLPFGAVRIAFQQRQIIAKVVQAQQPQASHQAVINHLALVLCQHDAGTLINQLADATKMHVQQRQALHHLRQQCRRVSVRVRRRRLHAISLKKNGLLMRFDNLGLPLPRVKLRLDGWPAR